MDNHAVYQTLARVEKRIRQAERLAFFHLCVTLLTVATVAGLVWYR